MARPAGNLNPPPPGPTPHPRRLNLRDRGWRGGLATPPNAGLPLRRPDREGEATSPPSLREQGAGWLTPRGGCFSPAIRP